MLISICADAASAAAEQPDAVATAERAVTQAGVNHNLIMNMLATVSESTIYLMGFSFILGSLFTILILIMLDFMRRNAQSK